MAKYTSIKCSGVVYYVRVVMNSKSAEMYNA